MDLFCKQRKFLLLPAVLCLLLTGCFKIPDATDKFAKDYIHALQNKDTAAIEAPLDPQLKNEEGRQKMAEVMKYMEHGEIVAIESVGYNFFKSPDLTRNNVTYQVSYKNAWLLVSLVIDEKPQLQVMGINVQDIPQPLDKLNAFSLSGKSVMHYIMLLFAIAIPIFILTTLIVCIRTKIAKRKWLWILFILFGIGSISLNWSSGDVGILPINFLLFGAGIVKSGQYASWILSIALPIGAVVFLLKRRSLQAKASALPSSAKQ